MNFPAYPVYVNDSVYDGAVIHRYVCVSVVHPPSPLALHRFIIAVILLQYSFPSRCCLVTMVKAKKQTVVSGSWWFTVRQYLMGINESSKLSKNRNEPISFVDATVLIVLW